MLEKTFGPIDFFIHGKLYYNLNKYQKKIKKHRENNNLFFLISSIPIHFVDKEQSWYKLESVWYQLFYSIGISIGIRKLYPSLIESEYYNQIQIN